MATIKAKNGVTCVWGADEVTCATSYGIVQSCRHKKQPKTEEVPGADGDTEAVVFYDERDEVELVVTCASSMANPTIGAWLEVGPSGATVKGLIMDWELRWQNKAVKSLSITIRKYAEISDT